MFYILINPDPVYPYTLTDLKRDNPEVSFPNSSFDTTPWNCYPVVSTNQPEQAGKIAQRIMPELVDNVWYERWELVDAPPEPVPYSVSMVQARLALLNEGVLDQVDAAIASIEDLTERRAAEIAWEYSVNVNRDNALVKALSESLGLDADELFRKASKLEI